MSEIMMSDDGERPATPPAPTAEALEILCEKDAPSAKQVAGALRKARHKVIGKRRLENHRVTGGPQQVWLVHDVH